MTNTKILADILDNNIIMFYIIIINNNNMANDPYLNIWLINVLVLFCY